MKKQDNIFKSKKAKKAKKIKWIIFAGAIVVLAVLTSVTIVILTNKNDNIKGHKLLKNVKNSDFVIENKKHILPSNFKNKKHILDIIRSKANVTGDYSKAELSNFLKDTKIIFVPNDQIGVLKFTITIDKSSKTFRVNKFLSINEINFSTLIQSVSDLFFLTAIKDIENTLPSDFKDTNLIKNVFKGQTHEIEINPHFSTKKNIEILKKTIDSNLKITFFPNDETGTLKFLVEWEWGPLKKTYTVTGFKTVS